jgi:hypothetical protein
MARDGRDSPLDALDHRLNPVLVKDVRCWLHSKKFMFVFFISLFVIQVITAVFTAAPDMGGGEALFLVLASALGFVLTGVLPFLMHDRFTDELASGSTELVLISRMTPGQLVRGKIASGVAAALLFFSVGAPSFTIAYMLGGVDLLGLFYSMVLLVVLSVVAMIAAIRLVAITGRRKLKILAVLLIVGGFHSSSVFVGLGVWMHEETFVLSPQFWLVNAVVFASVTLFALFFYTVAVSRLSFEADNRDARPRLALSALAVLPVLLTFVYLVTADVLGHTVSDSETLMGMVVALSLGMFVFGSLFVLSTPDRMSGRVRSRASRIPPLRMLLYPGPGRLYAFILVHLAFFSTAAFAPCAFHCDEEIVAPLFAAAALALPGMLGTCTLVHFGLTHIGWLRHRPVPRGLVTALLLFLWSLVAIPLVAVVEGADLSEKVMVIHPLGALYMLAEDPAVENVALAMAVGLAAMAPGMIYWVWAMGRAAFEDHRLFHGPGAAPDEPAAPRPSAPSRSIPPEVRASIPSAEPTVGEELEREDG